MPALLPRKPVDYFFPFFFETFHKLFIFFEFIGVKVKAIRFCETGGGKGPVDQEISQINKQVNDVIVKEDMEITGLF